jgi:polysaccharide deacetylase 2 family uncharacterized protein YibQ
MIRRPKRRRASRWELRVVEIAFCLVLVLALAVGGERAARRFPSLLGMFLPEGVMAAQADVQSPAERIDLPIHWPHAPARFAPQVLTPVPSRGLPDWLVERVHYARLQSGASAESTPPAPAPAIAIVIDDLGPDAGGTRTAIALPPPITLSFLPYGDDTPALARAGAQAGHQVILHLPMEPEGREDPGPMALRTDLSPAQNIQRLDWALTRVSGPAGLNNHMGSRFTQDRAALVPVMEHLVGKGLFFLDSRTAPHSLVTPIARAFGVASAGRDVFLDDVERGDYVEAQLAQAERIARETGTAIAIGHPHAVTLSVLKRWTAQAEADGYRLIPLSEAIRRKTEQDAVKLAGFVN